MSSSIIDKYKDKKKKIILSYAKILEDLIVLEENELWHKKSEFLPIAEGIIDHFVDNYYYDNNLNRNNPVEYLNDNINAVLLSMMEYFKSQEQPNMVKEKKNETFLLSVIICSASYIDIATNVIDGSYIKTKNNFKKLLKHLSKTKLLKVYVNNRPLINKLFNEVKKSVANDKKFFSYFVSDLWHNEYQIISTNPEYYKVRFIYRIEGIEKEKPQYINKYRKKYLKEYLNVCYELLVVLLMKEFIMNKKVNTYLVPVIDEMVLKDGLTVLDIPLIKNNLKLLVPWEKYETYQKVDNFAKIYLYRDNNIDELLTKRDIEVLVSHQFMAENKDNLAKLQKLNIKVVEEHLGKSVKEEDICRIIKEEEL